VDLGVEGSKPFTHPTRRDSQEDGTNKEQVIEKIRNHTKDNKIPCTQALKIAEEEKVSPKVVGEIINELKIKIASCQLGCFP
jgi:hypothetical protein